MKRLLFLCLVPNLFWGSGLHSYGIEDTLDFQTHHNLYMTRMLFESRKDDEEVGLNASFMYSDDALYSSKKGAFTLFGRVDDDGIFLPYLSYSYTSLTSNLGLDSNLSSHNIGAGIKSKLDTDLLDIFAGVGVGGSFNQTQSIKDYSYLFADAQLGFGKEIDFFKDRLLITPLSYLQYDYVYQKELSHQWQTQHLHTLSLLLGAEFDVGILKSDSFLMSFSFFGFYKHLFLGDTLTDEGVDQAGKEVVWKHFRPKDSGYVGAGLNFRYEALFLNLEVSSELTKHTYSVQTLAKLGMEF